jgi:hypothetical protein
MTTEKNKTDGSITYELNISKAQLLAKIQDRIKDYNQTSFLLADNVDYEEFRIENDKVKIKRRPNNLTTFGQLDLFIEDMADGKTNLKFEIIPFNKLFPWVRTILITFGLFLTIFGILINHSINSLLILAFGWTIMAMFVYFRTKFERYMMLRYTKLIIKDLS